MRDYMRGKGLPGRQPAARAQAKKELHPQLFWGSAEALRVLQ
jgi:hypothetical protein